MRGGRYQIPTLLYWGKNDPSAILATGLALFDIVTQENPRARMLISANVDRILWGTNWPHPNSVNGSTEKVSPLWQVDDGLVLNLLPAWAPDAGTRRKILVDNPARLYAF